MPQIIKTVSIIRMIKMRFELKELKIKVSEFDRFNKVVSMSVFTIGKSIKSFLINPVLKISTGNLDKKNSPKEIAREV